MQTTKFELNTSNAYSHSSVLRISIQKATTESFFFFFNFKYLNPQGGFFANFIVFLLISSTTIHKNQTIKIRKNKKTPIK